MKRVALAVILTASASFGAVTAIRAQLDRKEFAGRSAGGARWIGHADRVTQDPAVTHEGPVEVPTHLFSGNVQISFPDAHITVHADEVTLTPASVFTLRGNATITLDR